MTLLSELLSTQMVADEFGFKAGHWQVIKLIKAKRLRAIKVLGRYMITPQAVEDYKKYREARKQRLEAKRRERENEQDNTTQTA